MYLVALLLGVAILCFFLEIFVPSFGFLTLTGILCIIASIITAFKISHQVGVGIIIFTAIFFPVFVYILVKLFVRSPIILQSNMKDAEATEDKQRMDYLLGKEGITQTQLRPSGIAIIDNKRYDVVSTQGIIEKSQPIKVIRVAENKIYVKRKE